MKPIRAWAIFDKKGEIIGCVNYLVYRSYYVARAALDPLERFGHSMDEVEIKRLKKKVKR